MIIRISANIFKSFLITFTIIIFAPISCQSPITPDIVGEKSIATTSVSPQNLILKVSPSNEAYYSPQESKIVVIFNRNMDPSTINESTFKVFSSEAEVPGIITNEVSDNFKSAFTPKQNLSLATQYTAVLTDGLKDATGNITKTSYKWTFTTTTETGAVWVRATASAEFPAKSDFSSVVFGGKMWVIGGYDKTNFFTDVWSSSDGRTWTQETADAGFSKNYYEGVVTSDNKIWLIGGNNGLKTSHDVWSSSDGITWKLVTAEANFTTRMWFKSVVTPNNNLWVIGGSQFVLGLILLPELVANLEFKDVWSSSDGKAWAQVTATAEFSARTSHTVVALNNKIWVIGGYDGTNYLNDVWSSSDGKSWAQETANAGFTGRAGHTSVVTSDNKIWVIGGYDGTNYLNDVWSSSDGKTWKQVILNVKFSGRWKHASVVTSDNKIWVIGGYDGTNYFNDVWYTQ